MTLSASGNCFLFLCEWNTTPRSLGFFNTWSITEDFQACVSMLKLVLFCVPKIGWEKYLSNIFLKYINERYSVTAVDKHGSTAFGG